MNKAAILKVVLRIYHRDLQKKKKKYFAPKYLMDLIHSFSISRMFLQPAMVKHYNYLEANLNVTDCTSSRKIQARIVVVLKNDICFNKNLNVNYFELENRDNRSVRKYYLSTCSWFEVNHDLKSYHHLGSRSWILLNSINIKMQKHNLVLHNGRIF